MDVGRDFEKWNGFACVVSSGRSSGGLVHSCKVTLISFWGVLMRCDVLVEGG